MKKDEIKNIIDRISVQGKMNFNEATTEDEIEIFEERNMIKLPSMYKQWLLISDGGEFFLPAGVQMYGVIHKPVIKIDDKNKPSDNYIVIGALSSGDPILCEKNSEKVLIYNQEVGRIEDDEIYDNYLEFLEDLSGMLGIEE